MIFLRKQTTFHCLKHCAQGNELTWYHWGGHTEGAEMGSCVAFTCLQTPFFALLSQPYGNLNFKTVSSLCLIVHFSLSGNHRLVALADIFSEDSSSSLCQLDVRYFAALNIEFLVLGRREVTWALTAGEPEHGSVPWEIVCPRKAQTMLQWAHTASGTSRISETFYL